MKPYSLLCGTLVFCAFMACKRSVGDPAILLFNGTGTSKGDVKRMEAILDERHLDFATADSPELDGMSETRLKGYRLLIIPGGNFEKIGDNLKPATSARIRVAVSGGLNYLGICAGAFFAGKSPYNGLDLTSGVRFPFYSAERGGVRKAAVAVAYPEAPSLEQYWEDGPELTGWGAAVGKYPDGTPAIAEGSLGKGWVLLSGVHPEASEGWRHGMAFATPVSVDNAYAGTLVDAALNGTPLPHF